MNPVAAPFEFGLLGTLQVRCESAEIRIAGGGQRVLLAILLLNANRVVSVDQLIRALWDQAPSSARAGLHNQVKRLRDALGETGRDRVCTDPGGYLIRVQPGELDVTRMQELLASARAAIGSGAWDHASALAASAVLLWRGEPLADMDSAVLARSIPGLTETYLQAVETRIEAELRLGRHAELITDLRRVTAEQPLREHGHALLMLALYRCGRQGDALTAYQTARQALVTELGCEPGPELQQLHQQILSADPALTSTGPMPVSAGPALPEQVGNQPVKPQELPPAVPGFISRLTELAALTGLLDRSGAESIVISAIGGTAGVGKTALAVHWAHQVMGRFPDGQLYANLRGYDPARPLPPGDALAGFLRSLGVSGADIPPETEERAARYRSLLVGKRMLILLDNAGSADQVRPLLPGTSDCTVVITSRDTLAGLVARDGAARLDLEVLPPQDALTLLRMQIGPRVDAEPSAAAELARQCCGLPLALRVAAELAVSRPTAPLAALTAELADLGTRLDLLDAGGDPGTQVRAVFSWSYRHLDAESARTFRLLGLHPGPDFETHAVANLIGTTADQARRILDRLIRAHLVQPGTPGRYGMHDLLRGYARELTAATDTEEEQNAALTRLFDHYLQTAAAAMDALFPAERHHRPDIARSTTSDLSLLASPTAARKWLDVELDTLVSISGYAAAHDWLSHTAQLARGLSHYLCNGGYYAEAFLIFDHYLGIARRSGDRLAEATALRLIGRVDLCIGRFRQAADGYRQALALYRAAGDRAGQADALSGLGLAETQLGDYEQAAEHQREAVAAYLDLGDPYGEARSLGNLGFVLRLQGRYEDAVGFFHRALDLSGKVGDSQGEAFALARLGVVDFHQGRYHRATEYLRRSLALFRELGGKADEPEILVRLGDAYLKQGCFEQAAGNYERALDISREIGDKDAEADVLNSLGNLLLQTGKPDQAHAHHTVALRLASETGMAEEQAQAHNGLAHVYRARGEWHQARYHWQEALTRYTASGAPEAVEIRAHLATIDGDVDGHRDRGATAAG
jgi:DNA-binding SARP family transcriptional activator/tetratricopeptide (TPR) repeat protein